MDGNECGRQSIRSGRIVGGSDAYEGEFPWTVSHFESSSLPFHLLPPPASLFLMFCVKSENVPVTRGRKKGKLPVMFEQKRTLSLFAFVIYSFTLTASLLLLLNYYLSACPWET